MGGALDTDLEIDPAFTAMTDDDIVALVTSMSFASSYTDGSTWFPASTVVRPG